MRANGAVIGRVRSAAYGFTVRRNVALARIPASLAEGAEVEVDVMGDLVAALVSPDTLYDAAHARVRS